MGTQTINDLNGRKQQNKAGSQACEPAFVVVGKLRRPHGVKGEILLEVLTDFPERLVAGKTIYVGDQYTEYEIVSVRHHALGIIMLLAGIEERNAAGEIRNQLVYAKTSELPVLEDGDFYLYRIIGFTVVTREGEVVGILREIIETGANDVYLVKPEQSDEEILLPAIESVILDVNFDQGVIQVQLPEWYS